MVGSRVLTGSLEATAITYDRKLNVHRTVTRMDPLDRKVLGLSNASIRIEIRCMLKTMWCILFHVSTEATHIL